MRGRDIALVIGAVVLVALLFGFLGGGMMGFGGFGPGMMGGYYGGYGYNSWWGVVPLLIWVVIIGGVVLLVMTLARRDRTPDTGLGSGPQGSSALDLLRDRYARSEITREQYQQMRQDLEDKG